MIASHRFDGNPERPLFIPHPTSDRVRGYRGRGPALLRFPVISLSLKILEGGEHIA